MLGTGSLHILPKQRASGGPAGPRNKCLLRFFARRAPAVVRQSGTEYSLTKTIPTQ
jgi:hypothetical protein